MYTSFDAVSYLMDSVGGGAQDAYNRAIRQAVFHAYRDLVTVRDWRFYQTYDIINLDKKYYVHTLPWGVKSVDSITLDQPTGMNLEAVTSRPVTSSGFLTRNGSRSLN